MEKKEQDDMKKVITVRFIQALDYLIDTGRLSTTLEFEKMTGFRSQRLSGMRSFVVAPPGAKNQFVGTQHIKVLKSKFNVSMDFIFDGIMPIIKAEMVPEIKGTNSNLNELQLLKKELKILSQKVNLLEERVDIYQNPT